MTTAFILIYLIGAGGQYVIRRQSTPIETRLTDAFGAATWPAFFLWEIARYVWRRVTS